WGRRPPLPWQVGREFARGVLTGEVAMNRKPRSLFSSLVGCCLWLVFLLLASLLVFTVGAAVFMWLHPPQSCHQAHPPCACHPISTCNRVTGNRPIGPPCHHSLDRPAWRAPHRCPQCQAGSRADGRRPGARRV